uniref:Ig-like domain-containing protein n=1 Tax=Sinocyclocheilus rhinocerous TaxID=307959 RepID=A0A673L7R4_9TELE
MFLKTTITYCTFKQQLLTDQSSIMVSHGFYWTLWMLSCFGQYLGEDLQFSELANGAVGGSVVFAPDNPPSTSIDTVQWGFGTTIILTAQDRVSFDRITLALELWNLRLEDSGIYRLTVVTSAGHQLSGETSLQVFDEITNVSSEGTGSISSVQWMKDNSPLSPSNSIIFSSDNRSVSISTVQRSDSGEYQCTYRNPVNSTSLVCVLDGPEDVSIKGQDVVDLGVRVSLSCSANSEPSASFSWKFNGRDTDVTTDTFTIDQTDFTHSGDYECTVVMNNVTKRSASQKHALLVKGKNSGGGGLTSGAIAGIVIGVLVAVIVYLTKTKMCDYEEINDFQKTNGEGSISGNTSESSLYVNLYENVKNGFSNRQRAPTPPQVSSFIILNPVHPTVEHHMCVLAASQNKCYLFCFVVLQ